MGEPIDSLIEALEDLATRAAIAVPFLEVAGMPGLAKGIRTCLFDVVEPALKKASVAGDTCPKCGGDLDTGWECNSCGYDALSLANPSPTDRGGM